MMNTLDRKVPFSVDAEQSVLGSILIDPAVFGDIAQIISSDDFYLEDHKEIFLSMQKFNLQNHSIDLVTLIDDLVKKNVYKDEGEARAYIKVIADIVPGSANAKDYAKIVKDKSTLRKLITATEEISEMAYEDADEVSAIVDIAEQKIFNISQSKSTKDFVHIKDVLGPAYSGIQQLSANPGLVESQGVKSGFSDLDSTIVGFGKSDLIIVGARPGIGKTSFCLNLAANIAKETKKSVCIFSLEMSAEQLCLRMLSSEALVDSRRMRIGQVEPEEWNKLADACAILSDTNIYIDDTTGTGISAMKAKLRRIKNLGLVVVDYLQLMESESKRKDGSRVNEISDISRGLKILAKELDVPVIACSQLSRGTEKEHKEPMLSDLRDSGAIEQDADMVIFLSRDYYGKDPEKENIVTVHVAKNRHGGLGKMDMSWLAQYTKFSTLEDGFADQQ